MSLTTWDELVPLRRAGPTVEVRLPALDELISSWPDIALMLARATSRTGCYEPIDVLQLAMAGQLAIWVCLVDGQLAAAFVTELKVYPRRRVMEILFCGGGRMRDWIKPAVAAVDAHARQLGCSHIAGCGRAGWCRAWGGNLTGDVVVVRDLVEGST
jgi:hypothetical protein